MLKTRKWLLAVSIALVGMIVSLLISFFPSIVEAKAVYCAKYVGNPAQNYVD